MLSLRDVVLMLAGAQAFHTLSHLYLPLAIELPLKIKWPPMTFTARWNAFAIALNVVVTVALFWWAVQLS